MCATQLESIQNKPQLLFIILMMPSYDAVFPPHKLDNNKRATMKIDRINGQEGLSLIHISEPTRHS